ncbi:peptidase MA family protein [Leptospira abararensis]|uniref:peptidase MA family protein n=1 Tax=Leptospira abararensis TaxID=2810036 RepID=UPI001E5B1414|nr:peptidase MA family protein [Leptospira abararensis]
MHLKRLILFPFFFLTSFTSYCIPFNPQTEKNDDLVLLLGTYALIGANCVNGADLWARDLITQASVCVPVDLVSSGTNVEVYKERSLSVNYDLVKFARDFDTITYPALIATFGTPSDIDGDGKVKILVMDIRDGATANSAYVAGYFDPMNYFPDNLFSRVRSNYAEVLYLDGKELIAAINHDPNAFASTAAHEFQHLLRYPRMRAANQNDELWINEGTSEVASDIAGYGPQISRMDCYSGVNDSRCADGINGVSLLNWDSSGSDILKQYSYAYVFMRYLYDISGTTDTQRQNFFRETVIGASGTRANSTGNLINVFKTSANFDSTALGSQNSDVFFRLFALLSAQSFGITNLTSVEQVNSDGAGSTTVNLSAALVKYPLSTSLTRIITNPVSPTTSKGTIKQGSTNFYYTNTPIISAANSRKNYGRIVTAPSKGVFFWADSPAGVNVSFKYIQTNEEGTTMVIPKKPRSLKSVIEENPNSGPIPICGIEFTDDSVHTSESIPIE